MIHDGQRLPLRVESLQQRIVVYPGPDELQRNLPPHRLGLLRQPDLAHPAFAELLYQLIGADRLEILCVS